MRNSAALEKRYLVITTLEKNAPEIEVLNNELKQYIAEFEIILAGELKINHCIGCNDCWIKTPGICCLKDDYEQILIKMLQADTVIFLTSVNRGFVCSRMKNIVDRILPLATMYLKIKNGQMRHYNRYNKVPNMTMVYLGEADNNYLDLWLSRVQLNLHGVSLGSYEFDNRKGLYHALINH